MIGTNPKNLVISGGGIKGMSLGPAIRMLHDVKVLDDISVFIGSSVGGLTAAMLAVGKNPEEVEQHLKTGGDGLMDLYSTSPLFKRTVFKGISNLITRQSAAKGYALYYSAQSSIAESLGHPKATFADLALKAGEKSDSGGKFRNLEVTVTISDDRGSYQIVCSPSTTPNMPIALALRMTAGLPPVFPPVKLTTKQLKEFTEGATEPLVKYDRGEPFPPFDAESFYQLDEKARQKVINTIYEDIIYNSSKFDKIYASDGGVVDNLPIYLAVNKPPGEGGIENTIAFGFEEPWRRGNRLANSDMYAKDKQITNEDEIEFVLNALNIPKNDKAYHIYQNTIMKSRVPPSYLLAALQEDNMLSFETNDISAADFELETEKRFGRVIKSHEDKVSYLQMSGFKAVVDYLLSKGIEPSMEFDQMYPEATEPAPSNLDQINTNEKVVETWELLITEIAKKVDRSIKPDDFYYTSLQSMRENIKRARQYESERQEMDMALHYSIHAIRRFTEDNIVDIIQAKKQCDELLAEITDELKLFDKIHYSMVDKSKEDIKALRRSNPELGETFERMLKLKESSRLFSSMLSLVRDKSVLAKRDPTSKPPPMLSAKDIHDQHWFAKETAMVHDENQDPNPNQDFEMVELKDMSKDKGKKKPDTKR